MSMGTFTDVFGGNTVAPSEYRYAAYNISQNSELVWPANYNGSNGLLAASILELTSINGAHVVLPPADNVSVGTDLLIKNVGANNLEFFDRGANSIAVLPPGQVRYFYISNNSTPAGVWGLFTFGAGTSTADASLLVGYGLQTEGGTLRSAIAYMSTNSDYTVAVGDRAKLIDVVSGSVTLSLPLSSEVGDGYFVYVRNSSSGSATIDAFGSETINNSLTLTLSPSESLALVNNGSGWKSFGYGRDSTFVFSEIVVDASLPATTLSSADVSGRMIRVSGVAAGNIIVTLPAVDNIYFVNTESGLGSFNVTFTTGLGTNVTLLADQKTVLYSDGTNVTTAITTSLTSTVQFADGSALNPSINFALDVDTGFYRSGSGAVTFTSNGVARATLSTAGLTLVNDLAITEGGTGASTAAAARTNLGLGTIATQNSNDVSLTGGSISGITDLAVADGGTGASDAAGARTNLGLGSIATVNSPVPIANGGTAGTTAAAARTNLVVAGLTDVNTFTATQIFTSSLDDVRLESVSPRIVWRETDEALPAGLFRTVVDGDGFRLERNAAVAGDFSSRVPSLQVFASNRVGLAAIDATQFTLLLDPIAGGVNGWQFGQAAAGGTPYLSTIGSDTNISLRLVSKGNSAIFLRTNGVDRVAVDGSGNVTLSTDLAITEGGTGASTAAAARTNLEAAGLTDANTFTAVNNFSAVPNLVAANVTSTTVPFVGINRPATGELGLSSNGSVSFRVTAAGGFAKVGETPAAPYNTAGDAVLGSANNVRAHNTAKALVNFDGTGVVAIRDQFNVSSITDHGTGDYTVNYANAISGNISGAYFGLGRRTGGGGGTSVDSIVNISHLADPTTTSTRLTTSNGAGANTDMGIVTFGVMAIG